MKSQSLFTGTVLIGIGLYYFLSQSNLFAIFADIYNWPTLLCIIGIAFLMQAYKTHINEAILPGVILFGFGIHFHIVRLFNLQLNEAGVFLLIISLGLLLQASKTKIGMSNGLLLLAVSIYLLFQQEFFALTSSVSTNLDSLLSLWPILLVIIGVIVLILKK